MNADSSLSAHPATNGVRPTEEPARRPQRSVLYVDLAYTVEAAKDRKQEQMFVARHHGGYFSRVWAVHPLSDRAGGPRVREPRFVRFSDQQTVIEGVSESRPWPRILLPLNLLVSQVGLLRLVCRITRENRISAVMATDPLYSGLFGLLVHFCSRAPLVIHAVANYDDLYEASGAVGMPKLFRWRWVEKLVMRVILSRADLVIGGSRRLVDFAIRNGAPPGVTTVFPVSKLIHEGHFVPPADRPSADEVLKKHGIPRGRTYLLCISRLSEVKHVDDAVLAMKIVVEQEPSAIGLIAGEGPMRPQIEKLIRAQGLSDSVLLLGSVDQAALARLIPHCITLSPLTGMALFETSLGGSPAVAYDRDDMVSNLIRDGATGFLVPFRDHEEMGRRALQLVRDAELRQRMSRKIRETALPYADVDALHRHEWAVFDSLFARLERSRA